ncbi:MAG: hypothetical protein H7843_10475 [Nitrospirota bacterium]
MAKFIVYITALFIAVSSGAAFGVDNTTRLDEVQRRNTIAGALGLDQKQAERVIASIDKYDRIIAELTQSLKTDMKELSEAIKSNKNNVIQMLVEKIERKEKEIRAVKQRELDELNSLLTFEQRAKYILFKMDIRKDLREIFDSKPAIERQNSQHRPN